MYEWGLLKNCMQIYFVSVQYGTQKNFKGPAAAPAVTTAVNTPSATSAGVLGVTTAGALTCMNGDC
jgi:hypothetical protein